MREIFTVRMAYNTRSIGGKGFVLINSEYRYQRNGLPLRKVTWRCFRQQYRALLKTGLLDVEDPDTHSRVMKVNEHIFVNCNLK